MSREFTLKLAGAEARALFQVADSQAAADGLDSGNAVADERVCLNPSVRAGAQRLLQKPDAIRGSCLA